MHATWDLAPNVRAQVETVHRLNNLGAVVTHVVHGTSQEGFDAEWREVILLTVEGDLINRSEMFDEPDLDAAIASFEQLSAPTPRLENAASQVTERFLACFAAREWDTLPEILADNFGYEDRRRVVGAGVRDGRNTYIADMRASADLWAANVPTVMAIRGERLALARLRFSGRDQGPEAFVTDVLGIAEINTEERIVAVVSFDPDDFEAAIAELDARYLAGEAAAHAHTWSVIATAYTALNRHQFPATTPDWVNIDHRGETAFGPGDLSAYLRAGLDLDHGITIYIESVHRLTDLGAVTIYAAHETSREGFQAEWRGVALLMVDGEMVNRCEVFEETDVAAAIARFEQLRRPAPRLENAASQAYARFRTYFAARDWAAMAELLTADTSVDDHRRVVNAEIRRGRDVEIANMQAFADIGAKTSAATVIATRGERLVLCRTCISSEDHQAGGFRIEMLIIVETSADKRILARVAYDPDDIDAAFAELDARYVSGEAAPYAHTWAVIEGAFAAINRHELPELTPDWVNNDHRRGAAFATGDMTAYIHDLFDDAPDLNVYIAVVHQLSYLGAIVTMAAHGTSQQGFQAEWREIGVFTFDGDLLSRCELFDETDLDAALARFERLNSQTRQLENSASQVTQRFLAHLAAGEWDAIAESLIPNFSQDDRRRVVGAGVRYGRDAEIVDLHVIADLGITNILSTVMAIRGERLALMRVGFSFRDQGAEAFLGELLGLCEINADQRIIADVSFDLDDFDAAIAELDARYLAGEAAAHAQTWSVIAAGYAAMNRHEVPPSAPDYVNIDHRLRATFEAGDLAKNLRTAWDLAPDLYGYIEAVHRLSDSGAVVTHAAHGTSERGFDAEWRGIHFLTLDGDAVNRCEIFHEADLDAAIAKFDQLQTTPRPENAASQAHNRFLAHFAARNWHAMADTLADGLYSEDRRRVLNAGIQRGRDAQIQNFRWGADLGVTDAASNPVAIRGARLVFSRSRYSHSGVKPEPIDVDTLEIVEIDADERISALMTFDPDDFDAAFEELDARYLAGEAADHTHTWSAVTGVYAALNRHEYPALTKDSVCLDRRALVPIETVDLATWIRGVWDLTPDLSNYIETVHRLSNFGAVLTHAAHGTSQVGFGAEWRLIAVLMFEGDRIDRLELFDEADTDAALARFDQLSRPAPRLVNATTRLGERIGAYFAARDWDAMAELLADDICTDDRRRIVGAGVRHGRDAEIAGMRATAEVGTKNMTGTALATRGERLSLGLVCFSGHDQASATFLAEVLGIVETNADNMIKAIVTFDLDDIDAAFAELDARYLAGDAAPHAHTWTLVAGLYAALNRHELPQTTPDFVDIDHRRLAAFAPGDMIEFARTAFEQLPDISFRIEAVHRLSNLGAVVSQALRGTSREGFEAEWHEIHLTMVEGDRFSHSEVFDETDLEAALARFEELHLPTRRLENAASRMYDRFNAYLAARDWDAMAEMVADDICSDDRRRVVSSGIQRGRDAQAANLRAVVDVGVKNFESFVIATRGERLVLTRTRVSGDQRPEAFGLELLNIIEIDTDNRITAGVSFDLDDIDAAFAELDARYLAGEAAAHSHTWSEITQGYAALNRHELPKTTSKWVTIDHRVRETFEGGDLTAYIRSAWNLLPDIKIYIEAVHRLSGLGAVVTHAAFGTSQEGFEAEWRMVELLAFGGDMINRCELFDETDIDAAIARFEELQPRARRLENAVTQGIDRFLACFASGDWDGMTECMAEDFSNDDRRRVVGAGVRYGRDTQLTDMRAIADVWTTSTTQTTMAIRGERLALGRFSFGDLGPDEFVTEFLSVLESDSDGRAVALVSFDLDNIDAAFAELEARYVAGEGSAHAHTWSVIARTYAAFNRHEFPSTTADSVYIDHRPLVTNDASDLAANIRATRDLMDVSIYIAESVHRLSELGAVVTQTLTGTSKDGLDVEYRMIDIFTVEGDLLSRCEVFDEADLDAALARFEELHPQPPRLENAVSQVEQRFGFCFAARDWDAMAELLSDDTQMDDRRRVVNAGIRHGRDAEIASQRAVADVGVTSYRSTMIAVRGGRLALGCYSILDGWSGTEVLGISEINAENQIVARVVFDPDDIDAAFDELDARYLAGEAAAHSHSWSVIAGVYAAFNRHEFPATTPDWVNIDHRQLVAIEAGGVPATMRALWDQTPDISIHMEEVHRLSDLGAVVTHGAHAVTPDGFDAEWRSINIYTVDGDLVSRCEMFDEADLDAALARFDELNRAPRLENSATRTWSRMADASNRRDMDGFLALTNADLRYEDRRKGLRDEFHGPARQKAVQAMFETVPISVQVTVDPIAIRGSRLTLIHVCYRDTDYADRPITVEFLQVAEVDDAGLMLDCVSFDPDDINDAFTELTARWIASGEVAHPEIVEFAQRVTEIINHHDREALAVLTEGATHVNHRQLASPGVQTVAEHMSSRQMIESLVPDYWIEPAEVVALSAKGLVVHFVLKGTSTDGVTIEIPLIQFALFEDGRVTHVEAFDPAQRDLALARFEELNRPG
jgi:hypothetical protein